MDNDFNQTPLIEKKKYNGLFITETVFLVLVSVILAVRLFGVLTEPDAENRALALAMYILFMLVIIGSLGYGISLILGIIGLICSATAKSNGQASKGTVVKFVIMTVLPVVLWLAFYLICRIAV